MNKITSVKNITKYQVCVTFLDDGLINQVFVGSKVDVEYYLKSCLSNPCGLNLRNDFAHGLNKGGFLQEMSANRLFHIIILLSMIRINEKPPALDKK